MPTFVYIDGIATYQYWSILCTTGNQRQLAEIQFKTSSGGSDAIPTMTSATTSGVTMSGDSTFAGGQEPWRAGADDGTATLFGSNGSAGACRLTVDFGVGNEKAILEWTVQCASASTANAPVDMKLQYSTDGLSWVDRDPRTGLSWSTSEVKTFTCP